MVISLVTSALPCSASVVTGRLVFIIRCVVFVYVFLGRFLLLCVCVSGCRIAKASLSLWSSGGQGHCSLLMRFLMANCDRIGLHICRLFRPRRPLLLCRTWTLTAITKERPRCPSLLCRRGSGHPGQSQMNKSRLHCRKRTDWDLLGLRSRSTAQAQSSSTGVGI